MMNGHSYLVLIPRASVPNVGRPYPEDGLSVRHNKGLIKKSNNPKSNTKLSSFDATYHGLSCCTCGNGPHRMPQTRSDSGVRVKGIITMTWVPKDKRSVQGRIGGGQWGIPKGSGKESREELSVFDLPHIYDLPSQWRTATG